VPPRAQAAHQQAALLVRSMIARLAGRPLPNFVYRDFGSLVSFGAYSAIGSLMGGLIGGSLRVEGLFARFMYRSLYKLHRLALEGWWRSPFEARRRPHLPRASGRASSCISAVQLAARRRMAHKRDVIARDSSRPGCSA
jgi:NADH dehydrogenase